jgi:DNA polymerase III delta prime subunit
MRTTIITEERIREAIAVMAASGEKITLRSLRERVGGGSYDKLIAVLRKHEEEERARREAERKQEEARREPPPVIMGRAIELQRQLVRDLWGAAQELAEQQAASLRDQVQVLTRENMELRQKVDEETAFWREEVAQLELELQRALERAAQAEAEAGAAKGESERLLQENRLLRELAGGQPASHELLEQVRMLLEALRHLPAPAAAAMPAADPDRTSEPDSGTPVPATPAAAAPAADPDRTSEPDSGTPIPVTPAAAAPAADPDRTSEPDSGTPVPATPAAAAPAADPDRTSEPDSGTPVPATKPKTRKAAAREKKEGGKAKGSETKPLPDNPGPWQGAGKAGGRAKPNEQQQAVVDAVATAKPIVVVNAFAGTGKTSTLEFVARDLSKKNLKIHYLVFNSRNAHEAKTRMPDNVRATTAHGLAYHSPHPDTGEPMMTFFSGPTSSIYPQVKQFLKTDNHRDIACVNETISNFCHSADSIITEVHLPAPIRARGKKEEMEQYVETARGVFLRLRQNVGQPVGHDIYLKLASLAPPVLPVDVVMIDESQDLNPCMLSIVENQIKHGKQVIFVGDTYQHIYSFTGAIDAMKHIQEKYQGVVRLPLTASYRFGPEIAEAANCFLAALGCRETLSGLGAPGTVSDDDYEGDLLDGALVYRRNISMLQDILVFSAMGKKMKVIGGVSELKRLLQAVSDLYHRRRTSHMEVGLFEDFAELEGFAETDAGRHLLPVVKYVKEQCGDVSRAVGALEAAESNPPLPGESYVTLTTAHKAKGLEFPAVALNEDLRAAFFKYNPDEKRTVMSKPGFDELALMYVSITRAKSILFTNRLLGLLSEMLDLQPKNIDIWRPKKKEELWHFERDPGLEFGV